MKLSIVITVCLALPIAALADITGSATLKSGTAGANSNLNLDTGKAVTSGGDLVWNGTSIAPVDNAKLKNLGVLYSVEPPSYYVEQAASATTTPIPLSQLTTLDTFVVLTNGGNTAKVQVLGILTATGPEIILSFTTYVGLAPGTPIINDILNNSSNLPSYFPSYGIAPSSLFIVTGVFLADAGAPVLQSSAPPGIPTQLNGASISVTVNNTTVHPGIYYTSPGQVAAVLPAATPIGDGTLTMTYHGKAGAPAPIHVVPAAFGINTYGGSIGVATDAFTGALLTFTNSGTPGEIITLWSTGLGADPLDSDTVYSSPPHSVNTPLQIYIGNDLAQIIYQGSAGYPGVNQINLVIPLTAVTGCFVPLLAIAGGVPSNSVLLPITAGGGACSDPLSGLNGNQLPVYGSQTLRTGFMAIGQTIDSKGVVTTFTDGSFQKYSGISPSGDPRPGTCMILQPAAVPSFSGLDPGKITLTGPNGLNIDVPIQLGIKGAFYSALPANAIPQGGGSFTFSGSGGADVGAWTATLNFSTPLMTFTNANTLTTIDRSQGFEVTWSGGNPNSFVYISGDVTVKGGNSVGFICSENVAAGKFKVPAYITSALPSGAGGVVLQNIFWIPLNASGLDAGSVGGSISAPSVSVTFK